MLIRRYCISFGKLVEHMDVIKGLLKDENLLPGKNHNSRGGDFMDS